MKGCQHLSLWYRCEKVNFSKNGLQHYWIDNGYIYLFIAKYYTNSLQGHFQTIENGTKEQKGRFLVMLLCILIQVYWKIC